MDIPDLCHFGHIQYCPALLHSLLALLMDTLLLQSQFYGLVIIILVVFTISTTTLPSVLRLLPFYLLVKLISFQVSPKLMHFHIIKFASVTLIHKGSHLV